jgi:divinyl protochlorophyllide a 8-vinyl-reductase
MAVAVARQGKIGPSSIIQTIAALREVYDPIQSRAILVCGGASGLAEHLPSEMVDEREFYALAQMLVDQLGAAQAARILRRAGELTAVYLLRYRIPLPVQWMLRLVPVRQRLRLLLPVLARNASTFAGSGSFSFDAGATPLVSIANPALHGPPATMSAICSFYKGILCHLARSLISRRVTVWETECQSHGDAACVYRFV